MTDDHEPEVRLLAGGNPQIAKGDGDEPVRRYIAAMPEWKADLGRHLDELIVATVDDVHEAVKWNQPFYGSESQVGWFVSFRCFTTYVQLCFFAGASLDPEPPKAGKDPNARYLDIHEDDAVDDDLLVSWFGQASGLPGEVL